MPPSLVDIVAAAGWQFATSMPHIPHEYVVRGRPTGGREPLPVEWHDELAKAIRRDGYRGVFGGYSYRYLNLDGWKYWVIGDVINRERITSDDG